LVGAGVAHPERWVAALSNEPLEMSGAAQRGAAEGSPCSAGMESPSLDRSLLHRYFGPIQTGSQRSSVLGLASTAFGSALLVTPSVFSSLGLVLGVAVLAFTGFATLVSLRLLANGAYATGHDTYGGVVAGSLGAKAALAADAVLVIYGFFVACSCFIFLKQLIPAFVKNVGLPLWLVSSDLGLLVVLAVLLAPLCLTKTVAALRHAALLAVLSLLVSVVAMCVETPAKHAELMDRIAHGDGTAEQLPADFWWWPAPGSNWVTAVPLDMAICAFALTCHVSIFPIQQELVLPVARRVDKVLVRAMVLVTVIYALVGVLCFLSLGPPCREQVPAEPWPSCTPPNVLASPRFRDPVGILAQAAMAITVMVAIPFNLGAGRRALMSLLGCGPRPAAAAAPASELAEAGGARAEEACGGPPPGGGAPRWHAPVTLLLLLAAMCVGVVFESIDAVMAILGGFCVSSFGFAIPLAMTLALRPTIAANWPASRIGDWLGVTPAGVVAAGLMMGLTCVVCYASVVQAVVNMASG